MTDGFELHPEAAQDITDIWEYIAADSPFAARHVRERIQDAIGRVADAPHSGHRRPDLSNRPLGFIRVYDYLITYAPDEKPLWVLAVLHGKRDPRLLAAILRSRYEV